MDVVNWIAWGVTETAKYMIISYGVLGFEAKTGMKKYFCFLYLLIGSFLTWHFCQDPLLFQTSWGVVLVLLFYQGKKKKLMQMVLLEYLAISAVDTLIWGIVVALYQGAVQGETPVVDMVSECMGVIIWSLVAVGMRKYRQKIHESFYYVPFRYYVLISILILGFVGVAGGAQGNVKNEMTESIKRATLIITLISLIMIIVVSVFLICTLNSEKQLKIANEYNQKYFEYQKDYYEKLIVKDEELRRFHHDWRKHIHVLHALYRENKFSEIGTYLRELDSEISEISMIHTGNAVADYFVNGVVYELKKNGEIDFQILGRFPDRVEMSDSDLCVLLGNAFDNAREALCKVEGRRELKLEIQNLRNILMIRIANSAKEPKGEFLESTKEGKERHGYGTRNMKRVVEKHGGNIEWQYADGLFVVEMEIPVLIE